MKQKVLLPDIDADNTGLFYDGKDVILFGAGLFIQPVIHSLIQRGIIPACIIDNSTAKQGASVMGIPVISPAQAKDGFPDASVIITTYPKYYEEIISQLTGMGWKAITDCVHLLASFEYDSNTFSTGVSELHFNLDKFFYDYFLKYFPDKLIIPSIDIVITEKCSLKCRDCANLMQYYSHPHDVDYESLFKSLDVIMKSVDHVLELRVLGGETFMNRNVHKYIERLRQYKNYTRIAVYSNGTIVPKGENLQCLIHEDTYLRISDYGSMSCNISEMAEIFDEQGIVYDIQRCETWQDCSGISKRYRTIKELEGIYSECCVNKFLTLMNGSLYICPFAANADNLGAIPPFPMETPVLDNSNDISSNRQQISDMLRSRTYFYACDYCSGRPLEDTPLPAAIQTTVPLHYEKIGKGGR